MPDTRQRYPTVWGGVNQQNDHQRFTNQVGVADNVICDVLTGLEIRPGSILIAEISGLTTSANYRLHAIHRDNNEKYLVLYGEGDIRVFEIDGTERTVNISTAAQTYLDLNSADADQWRLTTENDYTFITNNTVNVAATRSDQYNVANVYADWDLMIRHQPVNETYHRTENPSLLRLAGYYQYIAGSDTFGEWQHGGGNSITPTWEEANIATSWLDPTNNPMGFTIGYQTFAVSEKGCAWDTSERTITKVGAFAGYTHTAGDVIRIKSGSGIAADSLHEIASKTDDDTIVMVEEIWGGVDQVNWVVDGIGFTEDIVFDMLSGDTPSTMEEVVEYIQQAFYDAGGYSLDTLIRCVPRNSTQHYFHVTAPTRGENGGLLGFFAPADSGVFDLTTSTLPFAKSRYSNIVAGTGTPATNTLSKEERWQRVAPPNQKEAKLDITTMPVGMVRNAGTPVTFDVDTLPWVDRYTGDSDINPIPSIFADNDTINDIAFHRDRMVLAGGEHLVFSQNGDIFNFFIDDPENIVDTDPIDADLPADQVTIGDFIVPFRKGLVIFTQSPQQFELSAPEVLTPSTAAITPSTDYPSYQVRPAVAGNFIYFPGSRGGNTALFEYFYNEGYVTTDAANVTTHVPSYLPTSIKSVLASSSNNVVLVLPVDSNTIYYYRYYWVRDQRQQSAWSRFVFNENDRIVDAVVLDDNLYLLVEDGDGYTLQCMKMINGAAPDGFPNTVHLDRQQTLSGTFDGTFTTFTQTIQDDLHNVVILGNDFGAAAGTSIDPSAVGSGLVVLTGDYSAGDVIAGRAYDMNIEMSQVFIRDGNGVSSIAPYVTLRTIFTSVLTSGQFTVKSTIPNRTTRSRQFGSRSSLMNGVYEANLNGRSDHNTITIEANVGLPVKITAITADADYVEGR